MKGHASRVRAVEIAGSSYNNTNNHKIHEIVTLCKESKQKTVNKAEPKRIHHITTFLPIE